MSFFFDKDNYKDLIEQAEAAYNCLRTQYNKVERGEYLYVMNSDILKEEAPDVTKRFDSCSESLTNLLSRVMNLGDFMKQYHKDVSQLEEDVLEANDGIPILDRTFDDYYEDAGDDKYEDYDTYKIASQENDDGWKINFNTDYNDMWEFFDSGEYKASDWFAASSKINDYKMIYEAYDQFFDPNPEYSYVDEQLEKAIAAMISKIPEVSASQTIDADLSFEAFEEMTGIESADKWMKSFLSLVRSYSIDGKKIDLKSEDFQELMYQLGPSAEMMEAVFMGSSFLYEVSNAGVKALDYLDKGTKIFEIVVHMFMDYSKNIEYLDAMQESLLNAGFFEHSSVMNKISELRRYYDSSFWNGVDKIGDMLEKDMVSVIKKTVTDTCLPMKLADVVLSTWSTTWKVAANNEIKGFDTLQGYRQFDMALTQSYQKYVDLMDAGIATHEDMEQADKVLQMLISTRIGEYESMQLIVGEESHKYAEFAEKIQELKEMQTTTNTEATQ